MDDSSTEENLKAAVVVLGLLIVGLTIALFVALRGPDSCVASRAIPGAEPRPHPGGPLLERQPTEAVEGVMINGVCVPK